MLRAGVLAAGVALAAAGCFGLERTRYSADWIADAGGPRGGAPAPMTERREAAIAALQALPDPDAAELGALAVFHYAVAETGLAAGNTGLRQSELEAAAGAARDALTLSPTRADLALVLAEIEFLRRGPGPEVYRPLALSFRTAPSELWIVQRRIALGLRLLAVAPRDIAQDIAGDIRILGEPFRDTNRYRILARAALLAGPAAVVAVERELGSGHPFPFQLFEEYLAESSSKALPAVRQ